MLSYKTRGNAVPHNKPKVFFVCHPSDFESTFSAISDDILMAEDCAIYYNDRFSEVSRVDWENNLNEMNLIVVPVMYNLLSTNNLLFEVVLPYAIKEHIPILPIVMSGNLNEEYQKNKALCNLQFLDRYSKDYTQIAYEEKLKSYLKTILISDEMARRVRSAFDAYVFLSYRKKDREYANSLMRIIHKNPLCRDIAIWYDEYLVPGENYNEAIEHSLTVSDCFALLVTPNLVNEENYVQNIEYPAACKLKKSILPVEMENTDRSLLEEFYKDIPDCINGKDEMLLGDVLYGLLGEHALRKSDNEPEHTFLMGLAYLDGIDVEIDRERALELITDAANLGLPEAIKKLIDMYSNGDGVSMNLEKALQWSEELGEYYLEELGEKHPDSIKTLNNLAIIYQRIGKIEKASNVLYNICLNAVEVFGYANIVTIELLSNLAYLDNLTGETDQAIEIYELIYGASKKELGEFHSITLTILNNLASCYVNKKQFDKAKKIYEEVYLIRCRIHGSTHQYTLDTLNNLAIVYGALGDMESSYRIFKKVYENSCVTLGKEHPDTLLTLRNIADYFARNEKTNEAKQFYEECYEAQGRVLGEKHPETLATMNKLAFSCYKNKDTTRAIELFEKLYELYSEINGCNHPVPLGILNSLAFIQYSADNFEVAKELYDSAYDKISLICKEGQCLENPEIKEACLNFASDMFEAAFGCFEEKRFDISLSLFEMSYEIRKRILGIKNEHTLNSLSKLAFNYEEIGNHKQAITLYTELYKARCVVMGSLHEDTLATLSNLAYSYEEDGDYQNAVLFCKKVYDAYCEKFGEYHSKTLTALNALADVYRKIGCFSDAYYLFEKGYRVCFENAGSDHPVTLEFEYSLANSFLEIRQLESAYKLFKDLFERYNRILGEKHPNTIIIKKRMELLKTVLK